MDPHVLVLNAGSSSLKFCLFQITNKAQGVVAARGQIAEIGNSPRFLVKGPNGQIIVDEPLDPSIRDCCTAIDLLTNWLRSSLAGVGIVGVGHRVAHGGPRYRGPVVATPDILQELRQLNLLAPLHQPESLAAIEALHDRWPTVPQVACFDTSFHRGHSLVVRTVPLPRELCRQGVERYGFHGLSYEYIASILPEVAPGIADGKVVVAHLGSGASLCALRNGQSVDTTMGFTAMDGLCMGTRPGAIDPGIVLYLFQERGLSVQQVEDILYRKSGLLGVSGISSDMRILLERDDPQSQLAVDYFVYRATKEIGALAAVLGGIDALVFTAGIGENSAVIRERIGNACAWLGVELDESANAANQLRISRPESKVSVWVIPTNEELVIARHTRLLLGS